MQKSLRYFLAGKTEIVVIYIYGKKSGYICANMRMGISKFCINCIKKKDVNSVEW